MQVKTIGIFDDHPLLAEGLKGLLSLSYEVIFIANSEVELDDALSKQKPDLMITDVVVPGVEGLELFKKIKKEHSGIKILAHTSLSSTVLVEQLLMLGVNGYVNKRQEPETVIKAIGEIENGRVYVPEKFQFLVSSKKSQAIELSKRENEILSLIVEGKITKEIADVLCISINTVENHRANLFKKFEVNNVAELITNSMQLGYITG